MHRKLVAGILVGLVLISLVAAVTMSRKGNTTAGQQKNGDKIAVINIEGPIAESAAKGFGTGSVAAAETITASLKEARENPEIKAVILRLNTPGGSAVASDEIGSEIDKVRQKGKKVVASMGEMAASGGYWISYKADKIMANPATFTGSIGVIMQTTQLQELYDKLGIKVNTFKSGPYKDMGASNKQLSPEERQIFQGLIDDTYADFVQVVASGRHMDINRVKELADGRIYTGKQAKAVGLVDELGNFPEAVKLTASLANIKGEPQLVEMGSKASLLDELLGGLQGDTKIPPIPLEGILLMPDPSLWPNH